jgi:carbamoyl-phosphate synthase large subunit
MKRLPSKIKKVLLLGSGALKIGEAGEFDYSGSQAIKALKEEGVRVVLINPNIATIQTSEMLADEIYFLPVTEHFVGRVIKKERPDGILLSFGGQTALNCGLALQQKGVYKKYGVKVLGTPTRAITLTEDRQKFAEHLTQLNIPIPPSGAATSLPEAQKIAKKVGFPLMIRAAFALGGQKSGVAHDHEELKILVEGALAVSPQVLVEKYLRHYKEVEYEVVRDKYDNCVTVCNMENFDPLGIHTGDSIVVAPSQTLDNFEYHTLRQASIKIVKSLGIIGECNVQFALNPRPQLFPPPRRGRSGFPLKSLRDFWGAPRLGGGDKINSYFTPPLSSPSRGGNKDGRAIDFQVIEVNARLSRSSALASKATGYPLAYVAAKLALGKSMAEVQNQVTRTTQSFFEPALDYVVVKIPRWDLEKFRGAEEKIGSAMKSVGEVMAIGRSFEEALQKAVRMQSGHLESITDNGLPKEAGAFQHFLEVPTPKRLFAIAEALKRDFAVKRIYKLTGIDPWFLHRMKNIVEGEKKFLANPRLEKENLQRLKLLGFSDKKIGKLCGKTEFEIRKIRKGFGLKPWVFQIDTLAGEAPAKTNYLYLTYHGAHHDVKPLGQQGVIVLGSGPYHIGSSVEFDWSCVNTGLALQKHKRKSVIVNCNPETVSTDYDMSDRLYFEDLSFETVSDIYEFEQPEGAVISVGGQRPNNLARKLHREGFHLLGTSAADIDRAENRNKFSALLDSLKIPQPAWNSFKTLTEAEKFAQRVGFPVLVRPSYVLSGSAMSVCFSKTQLERFIGKAVVVSEEYPVTISKFITNAKELEFDAVAQDGEIVLSAIAEHVENAGVHSGDATIVFPTQRVFASTEHRLTQISRLLAKELNVTGPFNIQFLVKDGLPYVIEVNLRASRTFPLLSKATGINFPRVAVDAFYHQAQITPYGYPKSVVVKSPQFSFARLSGADPVLHVEMASTGEVACFGKDYEEALLKSILSALPFTPLEKVINEAKGKNLGSLKGAGGLMPSLSLTGFTFKKSALLSLGGETNKRKFVDAAMVLSRLGYEIFATDSTAEYFQRHNVPCQVVRKAHQGSPNVLDVIEQKKVAFVVNLSEQDDSGQDGTIQRRVTDGFRIRRSAVDHHIPLFTDLQLARAFVKALAKYKLEDLEIKSYKEYVE